MRNSTLRPVLPNLEAVCLGGLGGCFPLLHYHVSSSRRALL